jgi:hypothetical protein
MLAVNQAFTGVAIAAALVGLLECFFGYRVLKVVLALVGFAIGSATAYGVAKLAGQPDSTAVIVGVISGLVGAGLLVLFYFAGVFILGAGFGLALAVVVGQAFGIQGPAMTGLAVGMALVGGILALVIQKLLVIIATSFGGAATAVNAVRLLFTDQAAFANLGLDHAPADFEEGQRMLSTLSSAAADMSSNLLADYVSIACIIILGIAGVIVQYRITRKKKPAAAQPGQG